MQITFLKENAFGHRSCCLVAIKLGYLVPWRYLKTLKWYQGKGITFRESLSRSPISMYPATDLRSQVIIFYHVFHNLTSLFCQREAYFYLALILLCASSWAKGQFEILALVRRK